MQWMVACLLFEHVFFMEPSGLGKEFAEAGNVSRTTSVPTADATGSDEYSAPGMKDPVQRSDSGLEGTTHLKIVSGVPGGRTSVRPASIELAIAPVENDKPSYSRSIFIKSDEQGKFKVSLSPGKYWLGPKAKALDPNNYVPGSFSVSEETVVVEQGRFTKIDLFQLGYAP
jgi:hypothetical protein